MAKKTETAKDPLGPVIAAARGRETVVSIELPLGELPDPPFQEPRHLNFHLHKHQASRLALKRLMLGLQQRVTRLHGGRLVVTPTDAIRWMLERIAEAGEHH